MGGAGSAAVWPGSGLEPLRAAQSGVKAARAMAIIMVRTAHNAKVLSRLGLDNCAQLLRTNNHEPAGEV